MSITNKRNIHPTKCRGHHNHALYRMPHPLGLHVYTPHCASPGPVAATTEMNNLKPWGGGGGGLAPAP